MHPKASQSLLSPHASITEAHVPQACALQQEKLPQQETYALQLKSSLWFPQLEEACMLKRRPSAAKNK